MSLLSDVTYYLLLLLYIFHAESLLDRLLHSNHLNHQ